MNRLALAGVALLLVFAGVARAADDPTGTWKYSMMQGDQTREVTLKLKLEGDKLTGTMSGRGNQEAAIENASFKDGEVSFAVTRDRQGQKVTTKYKGKLSGDTIKGTQESSREGQTGRSRDWEAKRAK